MATPSANSTQSWGLDGLRPYWELPKLPRIVMEWAAILPLVCHLASHRQDFKTTGEIALTGRVSLSVFPRLGVLAGLSRLVEGGPEFVDQASSMGGAGCKVWDVCWGSDFPCANGAASKLVRDFYRTREKIQPKCMPGELPRKTTTADSVSSLNGASKILVNDAAPQLPDFRNEKSHGESLDQRICHRRYQVLHMLQLQFKPQQKVRGMFHTRCWRSIKGYAVCIFSLLLTVLLSACGAYGTAAQVFCSAVSNVAEQLVTITRPPGYLDSNEASNDACMLLAPHSNSQEWTLFVGDRGIVDALLNKPMIMIPVTRCNRAVSLWFRVAHFVQLLAMTFVAANKGWDGVFMLLLASVDFLIRLRFRGTALAKGWASEENITANASTFLFSNRTVMLGAIEKFGGRQRTSWMDDILAPHPRRDAWIDLLLGRPVEESNGLSKSDNVWIKRSCALAGLSAKILRKTVLRKDV